MQRHNKGKGLNDQGQIKLQKKEMKPRVWTADSAKKPRKLKNTSCKTALKWQKL